MRFFVKLITPVCLAVLVVFAHMNSLHSVTLEGPDAEFFTQLNQLRKQYELSELTVDEGLNDLAQIRAEEVLVQFSHTRPNGGTGCNLILAEHPNAMCAGENLASGKKLSNTYAAKAFQKLCESPTHLKNMVNPDFTRVGIVSLVGEDGHVVTVFLFEG